MATEKIDRRGTPKGGGTMPGRPLHPGSPAGLIGQPPYVKTEAHLEMVRTYGPIMTQEHLAALMGISSKTLARHYREEIDKATANTVAMGASILIRKMLAGNMDALKFFLRTRGRWSTRVELTGKDGGPIEVVDLTDLLAEYSEDELAVIEPLLERFLAARSAGIERDDSVGAPAGEESAG